MSLALLAWEVTALLRAPQITGSERALTALALLLVLCCFAWLGFRLRGLGALQRSAERDTRNGLLLSRAHDAVLIARAGDGSIVDANPAAERLYGYSPAELRHLKLLDLRATTSRSEIELLRRRDEADAPQESLHRRKDGSEVPVEISGGLLDGDEPLVLAIVRDISARKLAALSLLDSEQRHRLLFAESPIPMWVFDRDTLRFLAVNDMSLDLYGYSREEFLTMSLLDVRPPEDRARVTVSVGRIVREGPWTHRRKDGSLLQVRITAHDVHFGGHAARMVLIEDVSESLRIEQALQESEERFRSAFDDSTIGMVMSAPDGTLQRVNAMLGEMLGRSVDSLVGTNFTGFVHPEDVRRMLERVGTALEGGDPTGRSQRRLLHADGHVVWVDVTSRLLLDPAGRPRYFLVTVQDITARRAAEIALFQSRLELQVAIESTQIGFWEWNVTTGDVEYSHEWKAMLGYADDEIGATFSEFERLTAPEDIARNAAGIAAFIAAPRGYHTSEFRMWHKNGTQRWILSRAAATDVDRAGHATRLVGCHLDITERRQAERALHDSLERFMLASRATKDIVWEWNLGRHDLWWSEGVHTVLDYPLGEATTTFDWWTARIHPEDVDRVHDSLEAIVRERSQSWRQAYRFRDAHGEYRDIEDRGFLELDAAGEPVRMVGAMTDVTARRRAEHAVQQANAELEQRVRERTKALETANRELESFSYSVSHDLRAPLRAISGFSKILVDEHGPKLDDEARRLLTVVRNNAGRMGQLIDDLLAFSRVARQELRRTDVDMTELADSAWAELGAAEPAGRERPSTFTLGTLPHVEGDPALLRQVWRNLLANAVKFSAQKPAPAIAVDAERVDGRAVFRVSDNGVGFDMAYADKLFGVFQRLHGRDEFEGNGVGLALVQRILQRHGGRAWAESTLGEGATFYFELPAPSPGAEA